MKSLAGVWKAPQYKMERASEVGTLVFGPPTLIEAKLTVAAPQAPGEAAGASPS